MKCILDIFRSYPDGQYLWIKAVENLEEAESQVISLAQREPGDYFIFDTRTGYRYRQGFASPSWTSTRIKQEMPYSGRIPDPSKPITAQKKFAGVEESHRGKAFFKTRLIAP
jgi:hypothetical protein